VSLPLGSDSVERHARNARGRARGDLSRVSDNRADELNSSKTREKRERRGRHIHDKSHVELLRGTETSFPIP
jgi:hypothetical protein